MFKYKMLNRNNISKIQYHSKNENKKDSAWLGQGNQLSLGKRWEPMGGSDFLCAPPAPGVARMLLQAWQPRASPQRPRTASPAGHPALHRQPTALHSESPWPPPSGPVTELTRPVGRPGRASTPLPCQPSALLPAPLSATDIRCHPLPSFIVCSLCAHICQNQWQVYFEQESKRKNKLLFHLPFCTEPLTADKDYL